MPNLKFLKLGTFLCFLIHFSASSWMTINRKQSSLTLFFYSANYPFKKAHNISRSHMVVCLLCLWTFSQFVFNNIPLPSYLKPLYQSQTCCTSVHMKMSIICMRMKSHFPMKLRMRGGKIRFEKDCLFLLFMGLVKCLLVNFIHLVILYCYCVILYNIFSLHVFNVYTLLW